MHYELSSPTLPLRLCLPRDTEQTLRPHLELVGFHVDRVIEPEGSEDQAEIPPHENASRGRVSRLDHKPLHGSNQLDIERGRLLERFASFRENVFLQRFYGRRVDRGDLERRKATQQIAVRSEGSTIGPQSRASRSIAYLRTLSSVIG